MKKDSTEAGGEIFASAIKWFIAWCIVLLLIADTAGSAVYPGTIALTAAGCVATQGVVSFSIGMILAMIAGLIE